MSIAEQITKQVAQLEELIASLPPSHCGGLWIRYVNNNQVPVERHVRISDESVDIRAVRELSNGIAA
jgi:hypothetical protein